MGKKGYLIFLIGRGPPYLSSAKILNSPHLMVVVVTDYLDGVVLKKVWGGTCRGIKPCSKAGGCIVRCSGYKWEGSTERFIVVDLSLMVWLTYLPANLRSISVRVQPVPPY